MRRISICAALLVLAACDSEPETQLAGTEGPLLLRAVYRDADSTMVLVIPESDQAKLRLSDCIAPLLLDTLSGQARVLQPNEVQTRLRTMQLAGATRSACPRSLPVSPSSPLAAGR